MEAIIIAISLINIVGLLWAEVSGNNAWRWLFKPLAAACFIALALQSGAMDSDYGRWLLAGLVMCWFGDVFLIPASDRFFLAGLGSFLTGHLLYSVSFLHLATNYQALLVSLLPAGLLLSLSLRWLWPHVGSNMRLPVTAYILVISAMLLTAGSSWGTAVAPWIIVGAWGFAVSDLAVARNQFVAPGYRNRLWGLPLYFGSQMLLAYTPALT
jgi:uncharacterized membrane protein YhhN